MCFIMYIDIFIISKLNLNHETNCEINLFFLNLWILYYQNGNIFICDPFRYSRVALYIFYPAHNTCLYKHGNVFRGFLHACWKNLGIAGQIKVQQYVATERTMTHNLQWEHVCSKWSPNIFFLPFSVQQKHFLYQIIQIWLGGYQIS